MVIQRAARSDLSAVIALLERCGLLLDGATDALDTMIVARDANAVIGVAAVELYADGALLRSVAVAPEFRSQGVGAHLVDQALAMAERAGVATVFLLTNTAATFFPRFGFERIPRDQVPQSVQQSVEFVSTCCASAVVMRKTVAGRAART